MRRHGCYVSAKVVQVPTSPRPCRVSSAISLLKPCGPPSPIGTASVQPKEREKRGAWSVPADHQSASTCSHSFLRIPRARSYRRMQYSTGWIAASKKHERWTEVCLSGRKQHLRLTELLAVYSRSIPGNVAHSAIVRLTSSDRRAIISPCTIRLSYRSDELSCVLTRGFRQRCRVRSRAVHIPFTINEWSKTPINVGGLLAHIG